MAIVSSGDVTQWLREAGMNGLDCSDAILARAIADAQGLCGRTFEYSPADAGADESRTFAGSDEPDAIIDDLLVLTSVSYAAVGGGAWTVSSGDYILEPAKQPPYQSISRITCPGVVAGFYDGNSVNPYRYAPGVWARGGTITIVGQWGYAATVPGPVVEAVCMLCADRLTMGSRFTAAGSGITSERIGSVAVTYGENVPKTNIRREAEAILAGYVRYPKEPHL